MKIIKRCIHCKWICGITVNAHYIEKQWGLSINQSIFNQIHCMTNLINSTSIFAEKNNQRPRINVSLISFRFTVCSNISPHPERYLNDEHVLVLFYCSTNTRRMFFISINSSARVWLCNSFSSPWENYFCFCSVSFTLLILTYNST